MTTAEQPFTQLPDAPCPTCQLQCEWRRVELWGVPFDWASCNHCHGRENAREVAWVRSREAAHKAQFDQLDETRPKGFAAHCPAEFVECDPARIPSKTLRPILDSYRVGQSYGFIGDNRIGKTRVAYMCLKRAYEAGESVLAENHVTIARLAKEAARSEPGAQEQLDKMVAVHTLLIDDLGKAPPTPRDQESVYNIIDKRVHARKALLWTSNYDAETLTERLGVATIERLREFTEILIG